MGKAYGGNDVLYKESFRYQRGPELSDKEKSGRQSKRYIRYRSVFLQMINNPFDSSPTLATVRIHFSIAEMG
jgi:hypothetical protein